MWSSDDSVRRPVPQRRTTAVDLRLPLVRDAMRLPWRIHPSSARDEMAASAIAEAAAAVADRPGAFVLGGGEPLRRRDLGELIAAIARLRPDRLGLCTSGHGLTDAVAERLRAAGVQRVHVPFHCARQDAHDWLVGHAGALKTAHRAIRTCVDAEMPVVADVVLTRPTAAHLAETIEVLARSGVRAVSVRRLTAYDTDGVEFVPLSPRLELLEESLDHAARVALERRVRLILRDLPLCAAPRLRPLFAAPESELWITADGTVRARGEAGLGCATCPGAPRCGGAPQDYVARFGWQEFVDPAAIAVRMRESVAGQQQVRASEPMAFGWRGPRRVRCEACGDDHERPPAQQPYESTRVVRARLVEAARSRPALLRVVGADLLAHPQAAALLYDALRLFPHVEVAGEASAIVDWTDLDLRRLKDLRRIDVALYGPDAAAHDAHCGMPGAFAAMQRGIERVRARTSIAVGAYAVLHDARRVADFADAWSRGVLPGEPRFRLSARGASLDELVGSARALPPGPAQSALLAVLPHCLCEAAGLTVGRATAEAAGAPQPTRQRIHCGRTIPDPRCGSDPFGAFERCDDTRQECAVSGCPGTAVGWQSTVRAERCSRSI